MTLGTGDTCKGKLTFYDVDGTHEIGEGYDVSEYTLEDGAPSDTRHLLERFVKNGGLRTEVETVGSEDFGETIIGHGQSGNGPDADIGVSLTTQKKDS